MSLHRVASLESLVIAPREVRNRRDSVASYGSVRPNKLSFNPVPHPRWEEVVETETVAAFKVPRWKRLLQVGVTVIYCFFSAGIVFGYAALKPILKSEGAYQHLCAPPQTPGPDPDTCVEIHLNFMFTVGAVTSNIVALPVGSILDNFGPRVCGVLGSVLIAAGSLVMAFAPHLRFDGYLCGYLLLALGGPAVFIPSFQLSNAFPAHSGLILALLTGAFDASSALFFGYRVVYEWTGGAVSLRRFFLLYLVVPTFILLMTLFLLPAQSYKTVGELVTDADAEESADASRASEDPAVGERGPLLATDPDRRGPVAAEVHGLLGSTDADAQTRREGRRNDISGIWGAMHGVSAGRQICSPWFVLISLFTILQMTRINYFIATVRPQYEALLRSRAKAAAVNNFFDAALPFGGLLAVPFIGLLLDNTRSMTALSVLVTAATAIGLLGIIPSLTAAYANVALFVVYRPFYYSTVSDLTAKVFGFHTFGTVYGALISLSGAFGFAQYGLDYLFHVTFAGDPVPVNIILLSVAAGVGAMLVGFVGWQTRGMRRKMLGEEAASAFVFED